MMERILKEFDVESFFKDDRSQGKTPAEVEKHRAERTETQLFYLNVSSLFIIHSFIHSCAHYEDLSCLLTDPFVF